MCMQKQALIDVVLHKQRNVDLLYSIYYYKLCAIPGFMWTIYV